MIHRVQGKLIKRERLQKVTSDLKKVEGSEMLLKEIKKVPRIILSN